MSRTPKHHWFIKLLLIASFFVGCNPAPNTSFAFAMQGTTPALATTQLTDTVYSADGTPASGTILISWPAFTTAGGVAVPAGDTSVTIGTGGVFTV